MSPRLKSALLLGGVFLLGIVTGGGGMRMQMIHRYHELLEEPPMAVRQRLTLMALDHEVHLDDKQREAVRAILTAQEPEAKEIRRSIGPRMAALRLRAAGDMRAVLRPDQLEGFQRFLDRQEARARAAGEHPGDEKAEAPH